MPSKVGIIGGTGLYELPELTIKERVKIETPFGFPSDDLVVGEYRGREVVFLSRHGRGHRFIPSEINYRANIFALKMLGVDTILAVSAVGSMKEEHKVGNVVIPDQFIDLTKVRNSTFFGKGVVAHVAFADPVCPELFSIVGKIVQDGSLGAVGGTYVTIEGPQFSTYAESQLYRSWGVDVIGMTNATEAKLAREAEICFVTIALVTDYDCWYKHEEKVTASAVIQQLRRNTKTAKSILTQMIPLIPQDRKCNCRSALADALVTDLKSLPSDVKEKFSVLISKYL